jgi:hypothetical protein
MLRAGGVMFWLWLLGGCVVDATTSGAPFECESIAITDPSGAPDACDVSACQACVDECGRDCVVLESYPPRYACEGGGSEAWDVYDFCPDWEPPLPEPHAVAVEDLGCEAGSGESLTATAPTADRITVTHIDYATGCCPESVNVTVQKSGTTLLVAYDLVNDNCECACLLDVRYAIADVPTGTWTISHPATGTTTTVIVP